MTFPFPAVASRFWGVLGTVCPEEGAAETSFDRLPSPASFTALTR
jgi:hypothetical protein